jgi:pimeloyl-ACP methyl ester carboxylesterase
MDARSSGSRLLHFPGARRRRVVRTLLRRFFGALSRMSPRLGAVPAEILFLSPPSQRRTRAEEAVLASGSSFRVRYPGGTLAAWSWGTGPRVLLVHGWGGHAGRLSRFVEPLVAAGFSVVAFDAPAHGASSGRRSSLPDFVDAILAVARERGPVSAPPADPERYVGRFARFFGLPDPARDSMKTRLTHRYGFRWEDLRADRPAEGACCRLLVVHDGGDSAVPLGDGRAVADGWTDAVFVRTSGLGHHRILREPSVVAGALTFLSPADARPDVPAAGA